MTVTELRPQLTEAPLPALPPLSTLTTLSLHVNSDTKIRAARHRNDGGEYLAVEFTDPVTNYAGVTVYITDPDVIRLIDALQATYPGAK